MRSTTRPKIVHPIKGCHGTSKMHRERAGQVRDRAYRWDLWRSQRQVKYFVPLGPVVWSRYGGPLETRNGGFFENFPAIISVHFYEAWPTQLLPLCLLQRLLMLQ